MSSRDTLEKKEKLLDKIKKHIFDSHKVSESDLEKERMELYEEIKHMYNLKVKD